MADKFITVTISPTGEVIHDVTGVKGTSCKGLTKDYEDALGGEVDSRIEKPEIRLAPEVKPTNKLRS